VLKSFDVLNLVL